MTVADKITSLRLFLAPVFFALYLLPFPGGVPRSFADGGWVVPALWVLFILSELTDLIDGKVARKRKEVSDFGKLFDPFADVLVRITYFLCFVVDGILPVVPLLIILYREFGILFVRILMMKRGVALGARRGGKIKALIYMVTGAAALLAFSVQRLGLDPGIFSALRLASTLLFILAALISLLSFADYIRVFRGSKTG
jgi:CDP-diacylglycerol--glycerol-3-phosphate 3-phosphatidyltransferase